MLVVAHPLILIVGHLPAKMTPPARYVNRKNDVDIGRAIGQVHGMQMEHVAMRLDRDTIDRVDALVARIGTPLVKASRSDVLRALVEFGIDAFEKEHGVKKPVNMADPMRAKGRAGK